tara:strand:- start:429 stop:6293 length:5865 start_codon:yes stop_codon:yes gene_type:complete
MAKKSKPTGFVKGIISDTDPRYQIPGSYRDAMNMQIINTDGNTFSIQNIKGNKLTINLANYPKHLLDGTLDPLSQTWAEITSSNNTALNGPLGTSNWFDHENTSFQYIQGYYFGLGQLDPNVGSSPASWNDTAFYLRAACNIVGHYSFRNQLFLIIVGKFNVVKGDDIIAYDSFQTQFLLLDFDSEGQVDKVTDLKVCYDSGVSVGYPNLNMDPNILCRVEGIIENDCLSRVYWTDNKNALRTLNLKGNDLHLLNIDELDISPKAVMQPVNLNAVITGNLPAGAYQYAYKYLTADGGESTVSPFSQIYHVSSTSSQSPKTYFGSPSGTVSGDGLQLLIENADLKFDKILLYVLYYEDLGIPPRVCLAGEKDISGGAIYFDHVILEDEVPNGLEEVLIPSNTWDVCQDIAIKDNILFAANLRQNDTIVSEKEWNVKVLRGALNNPMANRSLTTTDNNVKDYYNDPSVAYDPANTIEAASNAMYQPLYLGETYNNHRAAHRYIIAGGGGVPDSVDNRYDANGNIIQHLVDQNYPTTSRNVLGGESYEFGNNALGGCRLSFINKPKISDTVDNKGGFMGSSSDNFYFGSSQPIEDLQMEYDDAGNSYEVVSNTFTLGSNKDPQQMSAFRGYQRGETYRFGVLIYDKKGNPGNVLYIGDIQMPTHYDHCIEFDLSASTYGQVLNPFVKFRTNSYTQDFRISTHGSHPIPAFSVAYDDNSISSNQRYKSYIPNRGQSEGYHFTFDLGVVFEFVIPDHVREKISGYRIVRAERNEIDRTVIQSGLLCQTAAYGSRHADLTPQEQIESGYDTNKPVQPAMIDYCQEENVIEPYDLNLNTRIGLDATIMNRATYMAGGAFKWNYDMDTQMQYGGGTSYLENAHAYSRSLYFGSEEKGNWLSDVGNHKYRVDTPGDSFVMYSPDSAFGVRPYTFNEGHQLQIVASYKLYDQLRFNDSTYLENDPNNTGNTYNTYGQSLLTGGDYSGAIADPAYDTSVMEVGDPMTRFAIKKDTILNTESGNSGVLIGKFYCYDTYFYNYVNSYDVNAVNGDQYVSQNNQLGVQSTSFTNAAGDSTVMGGAGVAANGIGGNFNIETNPHTPFTQGGVQTRCTRYQHSIASLYNAKEIADGEFIPQAFFYPHGNTGNSNHYAGQRGFSNFSLGFKSEVYSTNSSYTTRYVAGSVSDGTQNSNNLIVDNTSDNNEVFTQEQMIYESVSTLQRGTRGILLALNGASVNNSYAPAYPSPNLKDHRFFFPRDIGTILRAQTYWWSNNHNPVRQGRKIPYMVYANIVKEVPGQYGGNSKEAIEETQYISCGNFHATRGGINYNDTPNHVSIVFGGDTFTSIYSHQQTSAIYDDKGYAKWLVFPVESYVNTDMRSGLHLGAGNTEEGFNPDFPPVSNDWFYNLVFSQENNIRRYLSIRENQCDQTDLPYEIAYSRTKVSGEQADAFRIFPIFNFHNVEAQHGPITSLVNHNNEIYFTQENAFGRLLVNPRTFLQDEGSGTELFTGTGETVETHVYNSVEYGTRHMHSVVSSDKHYYFVDVNKSKIIQFTGTDVNVLSDDKGIRDAINNLTKYTLKTFDRYNRASRVSLCDMPLYFIGIHGIYDYKHKELIYTFANRVRADKLDSFNHPVGENVSQQFTDQDDLLDPLYYYELSDNTFLSNPESYITSKTIAYNEELDSFTSYYSAVPSQWIKHQDRIYTPGNRVPFLAQRFYTNEDVVQNYQFNLNQFNNSQQAVGQPINGIYNFLQEGNENYNYSTLELVEGGLELWEWKANDDRAYFFGDIPITDSYILSSGGQPNYDFTTNTSLLDKITSRSMLEIISAEVPNENKKFDNAQIISDYDFNFIDTAAGGEYESDMAVAIFKTDQVGIGAALNSQTPNITYLHNPSVDLTKRDFAKYREGILRFPLRDFNNNIYSIKGINGTAPIKARMHGTFLRLKLDTKTRQKFNIFAITIKYRKSYN